MTTMEILFSGKMKQMGNLESKTKFVQYTLPNAHHAASNTMDLKNKQKHFDDSILQYYYEYYNEA